MNRKFLVASALAGTLAIGLAAAPAASASNVGWSVSIGGPGYAVGVGAPAYYGPSYYGYAPAPAYVAPPVVYSAPVVYPAPYYYSGVYVAPRVAYYSGGYYRGGHWNGHRH